MVNVYYDEILCLCLPDCACCTQCHKRITDVDKCPEKIMPIYEFPKNKTVHCIDCGCEMDAGLSCYTFEGKPICLDCEKERYRKYVESLPPVKIIQTTCKACGVQIGIFEKEKPFCFDCLYEFIYKVGKRNKEQINIFEV